MRALFWVFLGACGFPPLPNPASDGSSTDAPATIATALHAITPSTAVTGDIVTLEGTFSEPPSVTFPGATPIVATMLGPNRAFVVVPESATAGLLTAISGGESIGPIGFRRATFELELGIPQRFDSQTNGPRQSPSLARAVSFASSIVVDRSLYVVGGIAASGGTDCIQRAAMRVDGSLGPFSELPVTLRRPRFDTDAVRIGRYIYVVGGATESDASLDSVERAAVQSDGTLGDFVEISARLTTPRHGHRLAVVGNWLYAIGGDRNIVERAPIAIDDSIGDFVDTGLRPTAMRDRASVLVSGSYLYLLGGIDAEPSHVRAALASVERAQILGDGSLAPFQLAEVALHEPRGCAGALRLGHWFYLIGGCDSDGETQLANVERAPILTDGGFGAFELTPRNLPDANAGFTTQIVGNSVLIVGGHANGQNQATVVQASIVGGTLDLSVGVPRPFEQPRGAYFSGVMLRDFYAIGGEYASGIGASIEAATFTEEGRSNGFDTTSFVLATPLSRHSTAVIGRYVYAFAGATASAPAIRTVERASVQMDGSLSSFTILPTSNDLVLDRSSHATAVVGNYVYQLGGAYAGTVIERAPILGNGSLGAFALGPIALRTNHEEASIAIIGNYLYVFGGRAAGGSTAIATIERVAVAADGSFIGGFEAMPSFSWPRFHPIIVVIGSFVYAIGGDELHSIERAEIIGDGGAIGTWSYALGAPEDLVVGATIANTLHLCSTTQCLQSEL